MKRLRLGLWVLVVPSVLIVIGLAGLKYLLGHKSYTVSGTARLRQTSAKAAQFPALVCVGKGGPLETSGVYAFPLGWEEEEPAVQVLCRLPRTNMSFQYGTSVYSNAKPRHLHAYVWLEHHPELEEACRGAGESVNVPPELVSGYRAQVPGDWPCNEPTPGAVLGYAVAFSDFFSADEQHADIELIPNGYPSSRSIAR